MSRPRQPATPRYRLLTLQAALAVWALVIIGRLYYLQVIEHGALERRATAQQQRTVTVEAHRGAILDRNLTPLAMSLPVESLFANPHKIAQPEREAAQLAPILDVDRARRERTLASNHSFVWVARQITADQSRAVAALDLSGVFAQPDTRRFYPLGQLAAAVRGYVGVDGRGLGGLEYSFDPLLRGHDGRALEEVDARRRSYSQVEQPPVEGENLVLTLDQNIQYIAQQELDKQVAATHARRGMVVIENPHTGEILALANSPSFNPDDYQDTPASRLGDPAVSEPYEPGSVFKLVTLSAALQQGLITPDELIDCQMGSIQLGGRTIHDHAKFGVISVTEILQHSSDVGAIKIGLKLGDQEMYKYIRAYGFGQETGVKLPGESRGIVRPPARWTPMSIGAVSMGQEIGVTPLQVIAMVSTLADGGVYHAPRLVMDTFRGAAPGAPPPYTPPAGRRVVSPLVANQMKQMMAQVVLAGTAQQAQLDGYTAAGKTGTAQKVDPATHLYSKHNYIASFAGFAPINDPAVTILVILDSPNADGHGSHEGGVVAGPVFKAIAEQVLPYLGVAHDVPPREASPQRHIAAVDAVEESEPLDATAVAEAPAAAAKGEAAGGAVPPASAPAGEAAAGKVVLDYAGSTQPQVPDFKGMAVREVTAACERLGLALTLQGHGVARSQSLAPGTRVALGTAVVVRFTP
ncbi:MAG: penicillin-binding protein [Terriglobales bacterium]